MKKCKSRGNKYLDGGQTMNLVSGALGVGSSVLGTVNRYNANKVTPVVSDFITNANSTEALLQDYNKAIPLSIDRKDAGSEALNAGVSDAMSYAGSGAAIGSMFGPIGTGIGAGAGLLVGGITGALTGKSAADKFNKEAAEKELKYNTDMANALDSRATNINANNQFNLLANYAAEGGQFNPMMTSIDAGGTHEANPNGGVPQGIGVNGQPNLIEEGETKSNIGNTANYVFSDRLKANKKLLADNNINPEYAGLTYSEIAKNLYAEAKERENDPISRKAINSNLSRLKAAQELHKEQAFIRKYNNNPEFKAMIDMQNAQSRGANPLEQAAQQSMGNPNVFEEGGIMGMGPTREPRRENWIETTLATELIPDKMTGGAYDEPGFTPVVNDVPKEKLATSTSTTPNVGFDASLLRYAPAIGQGLITAIGAAKGADTKYADKMIALAQSNTGKVSPKLLTNRLKFTPTDTDYLANKVAGQQAGSRRAIADASGGNRVNYLASLLASDTNYSNLLGDTTRKAEEYNQAQRERVATFNRGTDQYNADADFRAQTANAATDLSNKNALANAYLNMQNVLDKHSTDVSGGLSGVADSLGQVGTQQFNANTAASMATKGWIQDPFTGKFSYTKPTELAKGGQLKSKKKFKDGKGLTYEF